MRWRMFRIQLEDPRDFLDWQSGSGKSIELVEIVVGSQRGVGKGTKLVEALVDQAKGRTNLIWAMTRDTNMVAREFYEHTGFELLGKLRNFYTDTGEDALVYGRRVP
jgi:ribosomal protein S18 acetylase RimI-like enzyme